MKITVLCSCGLLIEEGTHSLLFDGLTAASEPFYPIPLDESEKIIAGAAPYERLHSLYFSHRHTDHFSWKLVKRFAESRGRMEGFIPDKDDPEMLEYGSGDVCVECWRVPHSGAQFADTPHYVFFVTVGGKSVYITADAEPDLALHRKILDGRKADAAFYNGQYLSHPESREFLHEAADKSYIYHIPIDEEDVSGIRRKCHRNMERYGAELPDVALIEQYPTVIEL